jgi:hypothetical protein
MSFFPLTKVTLSLRHSLSKFWRILLILSGVSGKMGLNFWRNCKLTSLRQRWEAYMRAKALNLSVDLTVRAIFWVKLLTKYQNSHLVHRQFKTDLKRQYSKRRLLAIKTSVASLQVHLFCDKCKSLIKVTFEA